MGGNNMGDYPYILKPKSLEDFLKNLKDRPEPKKVTYAYLSSLGYSSTNERPIITILKFITFLDSKGQPTDLFKDSRDTKKSKGIMTNALKKSYAGLFEVHKKPCQASDEELENFFRTATGRGGRMLEATVSVFRTLCGFADFGAIIEGKPTPKPITPSTSTPTPAPTPVVQLPATSEGGVILNVSIQIELPPNQDADVYDKIFQSLKKHILTPSSKAD
jgi:hypothetical protein